MDVLHTHECIAFSVDDKLDSHAAMDKKARIYTFPRDGLYIVKDKRGIRKMNVKAGQAIYLPEWVIGEDCGVFFTSKLKQLEKKK